ncbi:MAG: carbamoyltransferase HypF [Nanoarchaeota archaeon]|nr:carbamoyltransferase HypF [Nanoarchaeota archaeon]
MVKFLALGAELNNTVSYYDNKITTSEPHGNTFFLENFEKFKTTVERYMQEKPDAIITDFHPGYNTSRYGAELSKKHNIPLIKVQHHLSHVYSVAREHGLKEFVGIAADGLGFGTDNTIWGGEIFKGNKRIGSLEPHIQLGGDSATKYPPRMLLSILQKILLKTELKKIMMNYFTEQEFVVLNKQLENKLNSPITTSCGRVLDAASALLGVCTKRTFEGEPAIKLEQNSTIPYELKPIIKEDKIKILATAPLFKFLVENLDKDKQRLAATVQQYLAEGFYEIAKEYNRPIVFSGGCAFNKIMTNYLKSKGVLLNKNISCGDAGISHGQIAYVLANPGDNISSRIM